MCLCKENHWCRDWSESKEGIPPSEHAPGCNEYEQKKFIKLIYDGQWFLDTIENINDYLSCQTNWELGVDYQLEEVFLTQDQFERLPEFQGF